MTAISSMISRRCSSHPLCPAAPTIWPTTQRHRTSQAQSCRRRGKMKRFLPNIFLLIGGVLIYYYYYDN